MGPPRRGDDGGLEDNGLTALEAALWAMLEVFFVDAPGNDGNLGEVGVMHTAHADMLWALLSLVTVGAHGNAGPCGARAFFLAVNRGEPRREVFASDVLVNRGHPSDPRSVEGTPVLPGGCSIIHV